MLDWTMSFYVDFFVLFVFVLPSSFFFETYFVMYLYAICLTCACILVSQD